MNIKIADKITYTSSRIDDSGIEVFGKDRRGTLEKVLQDETGRAYAVRRKGKIEIVLDTQVKP